MVLRSVGVFSVAKLFGAANALLGLLVGAVFTLLAVAGITIGAVGAGRPEGAIVGLVLGVGAVIILPVGYGLLGFVSGIVWACIFNLVAGLVGGVELHLEKR
ncbi:MAG: hypothetical protein AB7O52_19325 [Planctomycetota bacterium]